MKAILKHKEMKYNNKSYISDNLDKILSRLSLDEIKNDSYELINFYNFYLEFKII